MLIGCGRLSEFIGFEPFFKRRFLLLASFLLMKFFIGDWSMAGCLMDDRVFMLRLGFENVGDHGGER
jgi:hypothetical protein